MVAYFSPPPPPSAHRGRERRRGPVPGVVGQLPEGLPGPPLRGVPGRQRLLLLLLQPPQLLADHGGARRGVPRPPADRHPQGPRPAAAEHQPLPRLQPGAMRGGVGPGRFYGLFRSCSDVFWRGPFFFAFQFFYIQIFFIFWEDCFISIMAFFVLYLQLINEMHVIRIFIFLQILTIFKKHHASD